MSIKYNKYDFHHILAVDRKLYNKLYYQANREKLIKKNNANNKRHRYIKQLQQIDFNNIDLSSLELDKEDAEILLKYCTLNKDQINFLNSI